MGESEQRDDVKPGGTTPDQAKPAEVRSGEQAPEPASPGLDADGDRLDILEPVEPAADDDPFDLQRFVDAQAHGVHKQAAAELREGRKQGHWIWFELPQLRGLGRSATAERYGIASLDEARAYLAHPVLGPRLRELAGIVETAGSGDPVAMFGDIDGMKLRSSMTLFREAAEGEGKALFQAVLDRCFGGEADARTLELLGRA